MKKSQSFKSPSAAFRPAPFWSWNADLSSKELVKQVRDMAQKGWGGFFMHSRVGLITPYLSDEWHGLVKTCVKTAAKTKTQAWLYDEDKWPSGFAGGLVAEADPDFRMKAIRAIEPVAFNADLYTVIRECVVEGKKILLCRYTASLNNPWFNYASYTDLLNPKAVKKFLDITINGYKKHVGQWFGKTIPGIFTDEPSYCYYHSAPPGMLPWTNALPEFFQSLKGYSLIENLEKLFFELPGWNKVRYDFFESATRLFLESFTKQYHARCRKEKLIFTGHVMREDSLVDQARWVGAAMPHYEHMDWPGVDKLHRDVRQTLTLKQMTSVAEQLGKERAFCEVFGCAGQQLDFSGRRWIHNWEAALGVNYVNHHLSLYTMAGERKRDCPPNLFYQQPWWPWEKGMSDYIGRLNYALTQGTRKVDILVLHPVGSVWASFDTPRFMASSGAPPLTEFDDTLMALTNQLLSHRLDFHYGDELLLEKHGSITKENKIRLGKFAYSAVIVPASLTWRENTVNLLKNFHAKGGKLVFVGRMPEWISMHSPLNYSEAFPKALVFETPDNAVNTLAASISNKVDVVLHSSRENAGMVFVHERQLPDKKRLFFLTNTSENESIHVEIRLPCSGKTERLSCETGETSLFETYKKEDGIGFTHVFYPGDGLLVQVDEKAKPVHAKPDIKTTFIPKLQEWQAHPISPNVLRVDSLDLFLDGRQVLNREPICRAWENHFFKAPDSTPFKAVYYFDVKSIPFGPIHAVVERAHNLDRILLNGKAIKPSGKQWLDINFQQLNITRLIKKGENTLSIEGRKVNNITGLNTHRRVTEAELPYKPAELETIYIIGDFLVKNPSNERFAISRKPDAFNPGLTDITANGFPFFAGVMKAHTRLTLKKRPKGAQLILSEVKAPCVEIRVNGKKSGVLYFEPHTLDIARFLKKGSNVIELFFPTDLFNLMGPNAKELGLPRFIGPAQFRDDKNWSRELTLLPKGVGNVRVEVFYP